MSQPIERILVRHLGSRLAVPLFLVDTDGTMVFYNEAAEVVLGRRFDDSGEMTFEEWTSVFAVRDDDGNPLDINELPLVKALRDQRPAHARFDMTGLDGAPRSLEVSAFPLEGQGGTRLGAVALFWETNAP
ncbi:MAG: PAS domain-containing protein [Gemmatimonadales bacterium]